MAEILAYYSIGTTLANMANIHSITSETAHSGDDNRIPLLGPIKRQTLDYAIQRVGRIDAPLQIWAMLQTSMRTLINDTFGGYTVASKQLYVSAIAENGFYLPFLVTLERPVEKEHYSVVNGGVWLRDISVPGYGWTLQSSTKTSNFTVTTSTHYLIADTSSGSITFALPAIAGVPTDVPYAFFKSSASNSMILDPNGAQTINGAATHTSTALNTMVTIVNNGTQWVTI